MSNPRRSPQRLTAVLAVVGIAAGGALALPSIARADGETWRSGGCREGDGQTIVLDWIDPADQTKESKSIIRCILLEDTATEYPLTAASEFGAALASAGFTFSPADGLITKIEEISAGSEQYWYFVVGEAGNWTTEWAPYPDVDSFLGVSLSPRLAGRNPVPIPEFDMADPADEPTLEPPVVVPPVVVPPVVVPPVVVPPVVVPPVVVSPVVPPPLVAPPVSPPTTEPTTTPSPRATASPTQRPSQTRRPTTPPSRTIRPQRPTNRPQPPVTPPPFIPPPPPTQNFPELPPLEDPNTTSAEDGPGQATGAPNATPSRVWGREDATRQSSVATRSDTPAPWSQLAAVAGAAVIVGGLGTAFARGLQTSTPPVVEDE